MKVTYDKKIDAVYLELIKLKPEGVIEVADGINVDVTSDGKVVGIELLNASKKVSIDSFLTYEIEAESMGEFSEATGRNAPTN
jgi:uncharacterized protein YuzE